MSNPQTAVCTICSKNYLHFVRTLMESSINHHPDWDHYVLFVDEDLKQIDPANECFKILTLSDLDIPEPKKFFFRYNILELNTAVKPWLLEQLLAAGFEHVLYLDPDIYIYSRLEEVEAAFRAGNSIVLTPHLTQSLDDQGIPNDLDIMKAGCWNLGFLGLKRGATTQKFLKWWQGKLEFECVVDFASGRFVDQKWVDLVPGFYPDVFLLRHEGYNVAYWNLPHREISSTAEGYAVNGQTLRFLHFSGLDPAAPEPFSKHQNRLTLSKVNSTLRALVLQYATRIINNGYAECRNLDFGFNHFEDGNPILEIMRRCYRKNEGLQAAGGDNPFQLGATYFNRPCKKGKNDEVLITELMYLIWSSRADLQIVYPGLHTTHGVNFAQWFLQDSLKSGMPNVYTQPVRDSLPIRLHREAKRKVRMSMKARLASWLPERAIFALRPYTPRRLVARLFPEFLKAPLRAFIDRPPAPSIYCESKTLPLRGRWQPALAADSKMISLTQRSKPYGLNVVGYFRNELGIGQSARLCAFSAKAAGIPLALVEHSAGCSSRSHDDTFPASEMRKQNPYSINIFHVNADQFPILESSLGSEFEMDRYNIGYWHWELPVFPDEWLGAFDLVDEVWAPTRFVADAIAEKSPVPVVRVPHAIGFDVPANVTRRKFGLPEDKFLFLFMYDMFSFQERKNPVACIEAFRRAFGNSSNAALVIKTQNGTHNMLNLAELNGRIKDLPDTVLINETLSRREIYELQSICDCFVSLHRSEGFGLGLAESMFLGKPTIATNWSGNTDFMNEQNSCLVDYQLRPLTQDYGPYKMGQQWADADIDHAAWHMKKLVEDPAYCQQVGQAGRQTILTEYSYSAIGNLYRKRLSAIVKHHGLKSEVVPADVRRTRKAVA